MAIRRGDKIFPSIWYVTEAEDAARFYASIFPDSKVERVVPLPVDTPSGPAGSVKIVDFMLFGQRMQAFSAGPLDPFNHAISMVVLCEDQAELDRYWTGLLEGGGKEEQCGWLRDRYGVCWQIVPRVMDEMIADRDVARAKRVASAMLEMVKLDIAKLQAAYEGR
jgi:predicted 3-demethylubiquinone-9 3-methyltransferase (glyoxalase superfamily)